MATGPVISFESNFRYLYGIYCNYQVFEHKQLPHERPFISLIQIANWMNRAKLLNNEVSMAELRNMYLKAQRWFISYETFERILLEICETKKLKMDYLKRRLLEAGPPIPYERPKNIFQCQDLKKQLKLNKEKKEQEEMEKKLKEEENKENIKEKPKEKANVKSKTKIKQKPMKK